MTRPFDYSVIEIKGDVSLFLEERRAYSGTDLEYLGYSRVPNAGTDQPVWYIVKYIYVGGQRTRQRLPDDGPRFDYIWDNRATYFS